MEGEGEQTYTAEKTNIRDGVLKTLAALES